MLDNLAKKRFKTINPEFLIKLSEFNALVNTSSKASDNLNKLNQKNVLTVVTGQQVGLFVNPILALYKAIAAIKYAKDLEQEIKCPVVPIFWLQTEDHDHDEIRTCYLLNKEGSRVELALSQKSGKTPIGYQKLDTEINNLVDNCTSIISQYQYGKEAALLIRNSYKSGQDYGLSFAKLIAQMLPEMGLIFLDPTFCELTRFSNNAYKKTIDNFSVLANALQESSSNQVALRDDATLFFFTEDNQRQRLIAKEQNKFDSTNRSYTITDLHQQLDNNPEKFSASALLRPLIQDCLLPTIAYIGGNAEISYLKQSEKLYPIFNESAPLFIKRPSFTILEQKSKKWLSELGLTVKDLTLKQDDFNRLLATKTLSAEENPEIIFTQASNQINSTFDKIENAIAKLDQTLLNSASKAREKSLESLKLLLDKYSKAAVTKEQVWGERLKKIKLFCYPDNLEQERAICAIFFYARFGPELIEKLFASINTKNLSEDIEIIL